MANLAAMNSVRPISDPAPLSRAQAVPLQRARGALSISVHARDGASHLKGVRQQGSFRMLFPRARTRGVDAVMLNTSGGITGGDHFHVRAEVGTGSHLTMTTQAAERIYRAVDATPGRLESRLTLADDASMFWMPQETILFDGCALHRRLDVSLGQDARFLMVEPLVFGRAASGERVTQARFRDRVRIASGDVLLYNDAITMSGNIDAQLNRPAVAAGHRAMASVVCVADDAPQHLDPIRALLPPTAGASLLSDRVLVLRLLAEDGYALRRTLMPVLTRLTQNAMPKNWRL